jgi:hypothetical protein
MTQSIRAGFIVEGHGDVKAVPVVFRRIVRLHSPNLEVLPQNPFRVPRDKLKKLGELERTVEFVARGLENRRVILVLIDSDDDCPAQLGPALLDRARRARSDVPIGVALAKCEFENWFIAAASSLAGKRSLPSDLVSPASPETIRGAKEWLSKRMIGRPYKETTDQEPLAREFDLELARACPSFDKLCRETIRIVSEAIGQL